jgi:hypothetical protein
VIALFAAASLAASLHLAPCTIAGSAARCGTFDVLESPHSSRMLPLKVIVLADQRGTVGSCATTIPRPPYATKLP